MSTMSTISKQANTNEAGRGPGRSVLLRGAIWSLLVLGVGVVGVKVLSGLRKPAKRRVVQTQRVQVQTQLVRKRRVGLRLEGVGTVQALRQVRLVPVVAGKVAYVSPLLREGARVKKGTLLVRIDGSQHAIEYRRLQGQRRSLRKQIKLLGDALALDRRSVARNRRLLRGKAIDRGSYERQQMQSMDRQQRLEGMRQQLANVQGQLRNVAWKLRHTRIRVPFDARVTSASVERGGYVGPGQAVATLESQHQLELPVSFSAAALQSLRDAKGRRVGLERLVPYLQTLPPVQVTMREAAGQVWRGRVVRVGAKLDLATRTVPLWIRIHLREVTRRGRRKVVTTQPTLLPGSFCRAIIPVRAAQEAITVPKRALYSGDVAYLAVNNKLARRKVVVAHVNGETAVLTGGLQPGERLIISPLIDPIVGMPIQVQGLASSKK